MPPWDKLVLSWEQLKVRPTKWKVKLSEWKGIYCIFDASIGNGYIGSAYGRDNILGRWLNYSRSGHEGHVLLQDRDPGEFRFSILQRVSPDMDPKKKSWNSKGPGKNGCTPISHLVSTPTSLPESLDAWPCYERQP